MQLELSMQGQTETHTGTNTIFYIHAQVQTQYSVKHLNVNVCEDTSHCPLTPSIHSYRNKHDIHVHGERLVVLANKLAIKCRIAHACHEGQQPGLRHHLSFKVSGTESTTPLERLWRAHTSRSCSKQKPATEARCRTAAPLLYALMPIHHTPILRGHPNSPVRHSVGAFTPEDIKRCQCCEDASLSVEAVLLSRESPVTCTGRHPAARTHTSAAKAPR